MYLNPSTPILVFDYETYSEADLKKVGAVEYSRHQSTEIICAAWVYGTLETIMDAKIECWIHPRYGVELDKIDNFINALYIDDYLLVAHNASFERAITENVLPRQAGVSEFFEVEKPNPNRWLCTSATAASMALPRDMERAALVLGAPIQKNMRGNALIRKWCKPRKPSKANPKLRHDDIDELMEIAGYNVTDVDVTRWLLKKMKPLTKLERRVWLLDQKINFHGFQVDRPLIHTALREIESQKVELTEEIYELTDGEVESATKTKALKDWLEDYGVELPNMQRATVEEALESPIDGVAKAVLRNRLYISKPSTSKYIQFEQRSRSDGRVRDNLIYHGASTGRWSGAGVQPQNFPRGVISDADLASHVLKNHDVETLELLYKQHPMDIISSCLRSVIVAPEGHTLDVADYAAIEARVLFWVAEHKDGVKAFREGRKMYEELASVIYNRPVDDIPKDGIERFVGKQGTLGCGYMMGWEKFQASCRLFKVEISEDLARRTVNAYRELHAPVCQLWRNLNEAAISAVRYPGHVFRVGVTKWFMRKNFLFCKLPSGRTLSYPFPQVIRVKPPWGGDVLVDALTYYEVNSQTKKWVNCRTYGGRLTENVVQAISRDLMADAMLRIDSQGPWKIVLTVHDELVAERPKNIGSIEEFINLMAQVPSWGAGCPIKVEGWTGERYKK